MAIPSIYINLEDDVSKIVVRLKHNASSQVVLVCPKRCFLFSDPINLKLLKKQTDLLGKELFILTMDEKGQMYAVEAGFQLKQMPKGRPAGGFSDVKMSARPVPTKATEESVFSEAVNEIKNLAQKLVPSKVNEEVGESKPLKKKTLKHQEPKIKVTESFFPSAEDLQKYQHERKPKTGKTMVEPLRYQGRTKNIGKKSIDNVQYILYFRYIC